MIIQTTSPNRTGGHTHANTSWTTEPGGKSEMSPATAMNAAGAAAHRCGWPVSQTDSGPTTPNPTQCEQDNTGEHVLLPGMNGRATKTSARTRPAAIEPATIRPILLFSSAAVVRVDGRCDELSLS